MNSIIALFCILRKVKFEIFLISHLGHVPAVLFRAFQCFPFYIYAICKYLGVKKTFVYQQLAQYKPGITTFIEGNCKYSAQLMNSIYITSQPKTNSLSG